MSHFIEQFRKIENLTPTKLIEALQLNGYPECANIIRLRSIDGYAFLKLTEVQISLWRLPIVQSRRLWSFIQLVKEDPRHFLLKPEINSKPAVSVIKPQLHKGGQNSTMKSESFLHSSKIMQQTLNLDVQLNSINQPIRSQPRLYPKPPHLNLPASGSISESAVDDDDDENDGYLSPVSKTVMPQEFAETSQSTLQSSSNRSSFLNKFRQQNFENLEKRSKSVENNYQEQKPPLQRARPPLPPPTQFEEVEDEHLPEYTDLTDDDNEEQLPEYTAVLEDENEGGTKPTIPVFHRPLPPLPGLTHSTSFRSRPQLPSSSDSDISNSSLKDAHLKSVSNPNLAVQNTFLRKSPVNLPKPPGMLPKPPLEIPVIPPPLTTRSTANHLLRPLPPPPSTSPTFHNDDIDDHELEEDDEELEDYSEVDLANDPYFRDTDRKGTALILNGLEDGAFLIRPSRQQNYICTFSIMHHIKVFNLGVIKRDDGSVGFEGITPHHDQPPFYGVADIVSYYSTHPLYLSGQTLYLKKVLPLHRR